MLVNKKQDYEYEYRYNGQTALAPRPVEPAPEPLKEQESGGVQVEINRSLRSKCFLFVLTVAFLAAIVTAQSAYIVKSGYALVETKRETMQLERTNEALRLDVARLKAHDRVAQIAMQSLGMIVPQNAYFSSGAAFTATSDFETPAESRLSNLTGLLNIGFLNNLASGRER
jgi:cell division protein FtsL